MPDSVLLLKKRPSKCELMEAPGGELLGRPRGMGGGHRNPLSAAYGLFLEAQEDGKKRIGKLVCQLGWVIWNQPESETFEELEAASFALNSAPAALHTVCVSKRKKKERERDTHHLFWKYRGIWDMGDRKSLIQFIRN